MTLQELLIIKRDNIKAFIKLMEAEVSILDYEISRIDEEEQERKEKTK